MSLRGMSRPKGGGGGVLVEGLTFNSACLELLFLLEQQVQTTACDSDFLHWHV